MKVKVITSHEYSVLENLTNEFLSKVNVIQINVIEKYDIERDIGYTAYHIFYEDIQ